MSRSVLTLVVLFACSCIGVSASHAQQASIVPILNADPSVRFSLVSGVSANGTLAGYFDQTNVVRGFSASSTGAWQLLDISYNPVSRPLDRPYAISADGRVIVGYGFGRAVRWVDGVPSLIPGLGSDSEATGVSADGSVIVGSTPAAGGRRAFRWSAAGLRFIGTFGEVDGSSEAYDVSADGKYVVGKAMHSDGFYHAFRWSQAEGLQDLGFIGDDGHVGPQAAFAISPDGQAVVGQAATLDWSGQLTYGGFVWTEEDGMQPSNAIEGVTDGKAVIAGARSYIIDGEENDPMLLLNQFGVSTEGFAYLNYIHDLSPDGLRIVGNAEFNGKVVGVAITFPPLPKIELEGESTSVVRVALGQTLTLPFHASGPAGESLGFSHFGLPAGATVTPAAGSKPDSFQGVVNWTPTEADLGQTYAVRLSVRDFANRRTSLRFKLVASDNEPPTVEAPLPIAIECTGGETQVQLQARVDDAESSQLAVTWLVNGATQKTETVASGSVTNLAHSYADGENVVRIRVSDGENTVWEDTTVTVRDTTQPLVVVAPSVTLRVEPGKLHAWATRLPKPSVTDVCDEEPKVANNAPALLPIGVTYVLWTVTDASGNVANAVQAVKVVNARPIADAGDSIERTTRNDRRIRIRLDGTGSSDPDRHRLTYFWYCPGVKFANPTSPRPIGVFPVGVRFAKLTVTDAAGAVSKSQVRIKVVSQSPQRPRSAALRQSATEAYETAAAVEPEATAQFGLQAAATAIALDGLADGELRTAHATDGEPDLSDYYRIRGRQSQVSREAAVRLYQAYLRSGDLKTLFGSAQAYRNSLEAALDLAD